MLQTDDQKLLQLSQEGMVRNISHGSMSVTGLTAVVGAYLMQKTIESLLLPNLLH